jgi:hypothetical protein
MTDAKINGRRENEVFFLIGKSTFWSKTLTGHQRELDRDNRPGFTPGHAREQARMSKVSASARCAEQFSTQDNVENQFLSQRMNQF